MGLSSRRSWTYSPQAEAGEKGKGRERLIWKKGQGQIWITSASARRSVDKPVSPLPRHYSGWTVPDSGFQHSQEHGGSLAVPMLIWAALMLHPLNLPISCMCAHKHANLLGVRGKTTFFFFTMNKRDFLRGLAPCIYTEISGGEFHCPLLWTYALFQGLVWLSNGRWEHYLTVSTLRPATQWLQRHPHLIILVLPQQRTPFPSAEVESLQRCCTKPSNGPLLPICQLPSFCRSGVLQIPWFTARLSRCR